MKMVMIMAEYIEREAFIEDIKTEIINLRMNGLKGTPRPHGELYDFIDRINEQPTADVTPVRHGKWKFEDDTKMIWTTKAICSACGCVVAHNVDLSMEYGKRNHLEQYKYCPNCGARMDWEEPND